MSLGAIHAATELLVDTRSGRPRPWEAAPEGGKGTSLVGPDQAKDGSGLSPLGSAAANGHRQVVKLLLAKSADPRGDTDTYGWTPAARASRNGHQAILTDLMDSVQALEEAEK